MVNSRDKGCRGEREFSRVCRDEGYDGARRGQQYCGLNNDADVTGLPGIHIEVKRVNRLQLSDAMAQSIRDAKQGEIPIVAHRKDREKWLITMRAEDWFIIFREWEAELDIIEKNK
jgi:hypothetical protein